MVALSENGEYQAGISRQGHGVEEQEAPAGLAANYYLYLTQGGTDDATYTAGQFLIKLYGHAVMS